jgi:DNA helicase-2/ATP-dependent DNA helicase PcrA
MAQPDADPERTGFISFSNQAIDTMRERLLRDPRMQRHRFATFQWFQTIHAMSNRLIPDRKQVVDDTAQQELCKDWGLSPLCPTEYSLLRVCRENVLDRSYRHSRYPAGFRRQVETFIERFEAYKKAERMVDFQDMLDRFLKEGAVPELDVLYVDEAQDLSIDQWAVVIKLSTLAQKAVIAGDYNQAIYGFAGARPEFFKELQRDTEEVLPQTYRFGADIHRVAMQMLVRNNSVVPYKPHPERKSKVALAPSLRAAVGLIQPYSDVLLLARTNYALDEAVFKTLLPEGIYPDIKGGLTQPVARFTMHIFDLVQIYYASRTEPITGRELNALKERLHYPLPTCHQRNLTWQQAFKGIKPEVIRNVENLITTKASLRRVRLSSIHAAKGSEADTVILLPDVTRDQRNAINKNDETELLTLYVGLTRAKTNLILVTRGSSQFRYPFEQIVEDACRGSV